MRYISTRGGIDPIPFTDAVMMGLADDGGLLLPARIPDVRDRLAAWRDLSYQDLAAEILGLYVDDIPAADLRGLIDRGHATFDDPRITPLAAVAGLYVQELWHGPTLAFKDLALQFLGRLFEYILRRRGRTLNILAATSGDTGSAAIHGVRGREGMHIFVLHPHGRVSPVQARQMTSVLDANVHNIAVEGTFDDCQAIVKGLFADLAFKEAYALGAVNSVNWARVLAQIVYYFYGAFAVQRATGAAAVRMVVPTGNFGNIFAGFLARRMGAPIAELVLATNENDILHRCFAEGVYARGDVHHTLSPSMDIQIASNFERYLYYRLGEDPARVVAAMATFAADGRLDLRGAPDPDSGIVSGMGDSATTLRTIRAVFDSPGATGAPADPRIDAIRGGYVLDPHTAVGVSVLATLDRADELPAVCLATAHPAKFEDAIVRALGENPAEHPRLEALKDPELPTRCAVLPNDPEAVRAFVVDTLA